MTPVKAVNHIGIAVRSIDAQRPFYEGALGAVCEGYEDVPNQKVRVGFFRIGDVRLELLEPSDPSSTIAGFIEKRGEGLHHVALTVERLEDRIAELKQGGIRMIDEAPRPGAAVVPEPRAADVHRPVGAAATPPGLPLSLAHGTWHVRPGVACLAGRPRVNANRVSPALPG